MRESLLSEEKRSAPIDLVHQVVFFRASLFDAGEGDGRGIIDDNIDSPKCFYNFGDCRVNILFTS
jgi:hypothetical protein